MYIPSMLDRRLFLLQSFAVASVLALPEVGVARSAGVAGPRMVRVFHALAYETVVGDDTRSIIITHHKLLKHPLGPEWTAWDVFSQGRNAPTISAGNVKGLDWDRVKREAEAASGGSTFTGHFRKTSWQEVGGSSDPSCFDGVELWEGDDSTVVWTAKLRNGTIRADGRHGEHFTDGRAGSYEEAYRLGEAEYARFKALNA